MNEHDDSYDALGGMINAINTKQSTYYVFYGSLVYGEYLSITNQIRLDLPDGCYLYYPIKQWNHHWYKKDLTPVLLEDVPKELLTLVLIMNI